RHDRQRRPARRRGRPGQLLRAHRRGVGRARPRRGTSVGTALFPVLMNVTALLLADSRFPGGGHAHSGGLEEAAARRLVSTVDSLPGFLRSRLYTTGFLAAVFAAAAAHAARREAGA